MLEDSLLRRLAQQARIEARKSEWSSGNRVWRAGRALAVLLSGRRVLRVLSLVSGDAKKAPAFCGSLFFSLSCYASSSSVFPLVVTRAAARGIGCSAVRGL